MFHSGAVLPMNREDTMPLPWRAFFLLVPFGLLLFSQLVISDLPAIFLLLTAVWKFLRAGLPSLNRIDACFIGFVGISALGREIPAVPGDYIFELLAITFLYALFRAVSGFLCSEERMQHAVALVAGTMLFVMLADFFVILLQKLDASLLLAAYVPVVPAGKLSWPFQFSGQLGISLTVLFPLCVAVLGRSMPLRLLLSILFLSSCGATGSRSVFWLAVFEILYSEFFIFKSRSGPSNLLKALAVCCAIAGTLLLFADDFSFQRSLGQTEETPLFFDEPRLRQIIMAFKELPVWARGIGLGCFSPIYATEIHNTPLNLIVETGVPGFIFSCLMLFELIKAFSGKGRRERDILHAALVMALLAAAFHSLFRNLLTNRACWFILALCYSYGQRPDAAGSAANPLMPAAVYSQPQQELPANGFEQRI